MVAWPASNSGHWLDLSDPRPLYNDETDYAGELNEWLHDDRSTMTGGLLVLGYANVVSLPARRPHDPPSHAFIRARWRRGKARLCPGEVDAWTYLSAGRTCLMVKFTLERSGLPGSAPSYGARGAAPSLLSPHAAVLTGASPLPGNMGNVKLKQVLAVQDWLMDADKCPTECVALPHSPTLSLAPYSRLQSPRLTAPHRALAGGTSSSASAVRTRATTTPACAPRLERAHARQGRACAAAVTSGGAVARGDGSEGRVARLRTRERARRR